MTKTTDIYGNYSINEYDGLGRLVRSADNESTASPTPYYSTYEYDVLGRVLKSRTPLDANIYNESKYYYDNNGNVIKSLVKNGDGENDYSKTITEYDWRNNPIKVLTEGTDTAYCYDPVGNVLRMYTGELEELEITALDNISGAEVEVTKYTYDTQNRVTSVEDALGKTETKTYDINGNTVKVTDRNGKILNYTYDPLGNMTERSAKNSDDAEKENIYTFTFNRMNLPLTMTGEGVTTTRTLGDIGDVHYLSTFLLTNERICGGHCDRKCFEEGTWIWEKS